jgi:hypothetical protein
VEAIPEDAEYIGIPAFRFVFNFDPALAKLRLAGANPEVEQRLRELEKAKGLTVTCLGCYAFSEGHNKFFLLAPGLAESDSPIPEECDPLFYRARPSP